MSYSSNLELACRFEELALETLKYEFIDYAISEVIKPYKEVTNIFIALVKKTGIGTEQTKNYFSFLIRPKYACSLVVPESRFFLFEKRRQQRRVWVWELNFNFFLCLHFSSHISHRTKRKGIS